MVVLGLVVGSCYEQCHSVTSVFHIPCHSPPTALSTNPHLPYCCSPQVCTVVPEGTDQDYLPTFVPYICLPNPCTIPDTFVKKFNIRSGLESKDHSVFCGGPFTPYSVAFCCHPLAAARVEAGGSRLSISNWRIKEFRRDQKFAPGYRSSYYCEQYSKEVCDGIDDQCFLRTVDRSTALPGEFPHQVQISLYDRSNRK
ncbi:hypothetical protein J6590_072764 [Homalodisca vitripennis]|nr:hypothetical protein J6590_072764 [Homalodisca vitripennis]